MGIQTPLEKLDTFSYENGIGIRKNITFGLTQDEIKVYNGIHDTAAQQSYRENAMKDRYPQYADGTIWDAPKVFDSNVQTALNKLSTVSKLMDPIYLNMIDSAEFENLVKEAEANGAMDIITNAPTDGSVSFEQYVCDNLSDNPDTGKIAYQVYMDEWLDDRYDYGSFAGPTSSASVERRDFVEAIQAMYNGELTPEDIDEKGLFTEKVDAHEISGVEPLEQDDVEAIDDTEAVEELEVNDGSVVVEEKKSDVDKSFWNDIKVNLSVAMLSIQNWLKNSGFGEWFSKTVDAIEDKLDNVFDKDKGDDGENIQDENGISNETPNLDVPSDFSGHTEPDVTNFYSNSLQNAQNTAEARVTAAESLLSSYSSSSKDEAELDIDSV